LKLRAKNNCKKVKNKAKKGAWEVNFDVSREKYLLRGEEGKYGFWTDIYGKVLP
jgi:hypothetical protein